MQDEMLDWEYLKNPVALTRHWKLPESHKGRQTQVSEHPFGIHPAPAWHCGARHGTKPLNYRRSVGIIQDRTHSSSLLYVHYTTSVEHLAAPSFAVGRLVGHVG